MVVCTVDVVNTVSLVFAVPAYYRIHLGLLNNSGELPRFKVVAFLYL